MLQFLTDASEEVASKLSIFAHVRNIIYTKEEKYDLKHTWQRIAGAVATITLDMLYHHWSYSKYCVEVFKATNRAYSKALNRSVSQHFLNIIKNGILLN